MKPLAPSSDTVGLNARAIDDIAMVLSVLAPPAEAESASSLARPLRIGWFPGPNAGQASPQASAALSEVRRLLLAHGAQLVTPHIGLQMLTFVEILTLPNGADVAVETV